MKKKVFKLLSLFLLCISIFSLFLGTSFAEEIPDEYSYLKLESFNETTESYIQKILHVNQFSNENATLTNIFFVIL